MVADLSTDTTTSGGSSDKDMTALAVMPVMSPFLYRVVTTVTPVANLPIISRCSRESNAIDPPFIAIATTP